MGSYVKAGSTYEFQNINKKEVSIEGRKIMLAKAEDSYHAIDSRCPHLGGNLAAGRLEGLIITCPLHGSQFDITDGHNIRWLKSGGLLSSLGKLIKTPRAVRSYNVKVEDDSILVEI